MTSLTLDRSTILRLIESARPLSEVRDLLASWVDAGASKEEVRAALNDVRSELQAAGREAEEDRLLEALDLVEGWVSPHLKLVFSGRDRGPEASMATIHLHMDTIYLGNAEAAAVTGSQVDILQGLLKAAARSNPSFDPGPIDGKGGSKTRAAVGNFQEAKALTTDFIVGPITWKALIEDRT